MTDQTRQVELSTGRRQGTEGLHDIYDDLQEAVDIAFEQDGRTALTQDGRVIAAIVTAEDLQRLEAMDQAALYGAQMPAGATALTEGMITRLAELLARLGELSDAGGILGHRPAEIERWLRNGER